MPFVYIALVASYFAVSSRRLAKFGICQLCKHQGQLWKPLKLCCIKWEQSLLTTWKLRSVLAVNCVVPGNVWDIYVKKSVSVGEMDIFRKPKRACCCCLLAPGMQRWTQECPVHHYGSFTRVFFCATGKVNVLYYSRQDCYIVFSKLVYDFVLKKQLVSKSWSCRFF